MMGKRADVRGTGSVRTRRHPDSRVQDVICWRARARRDTDRRRHLGPGDCETMSEREKEIREKAIFWGLGIYHTGSGRAASPHGADTA